jgi:N6-adenosine-specific RNA methylase IME4
MTPQNKQAGAPPSPVTEDRRAFGACVARRLTFHEYANLFPMLQGEAMDALRNDIREHGILDPIIMYQGAVLDGRNRLTCARDLGIEFPTVEFEGRDPLAFVISHNLHRRHLTESQRASIAARVANMGQGRPSDKGANLPLLSERATAQSPIPISDAAAMMNVSERSVKTARKVQARGSEELIAAVDAGVASVSAAGSLADLPKADQSEIVAKGEKEILAAAKAIRADRAEKSRVVRLDKIEEISRGNRDLDITTTYPVIYADPPWRYENPPIGASNRSIENHYPTMTLDDICAMPVSEMAAPDAMLYLWATAPKLEECFAVIKAWGFEYRTHIVWDKGKIGMGYHARNQHELLLICKRGQIPPPAPGTQPASVYREAREAHSAKPIFFYEMIESAYPKLPKIELFCRLPREGWSVWGNQSERQE